MNALAMLPAAQTLSDAELEDAITTLAAEMHAAEYRFLTLIAELERRRAWFVHGVKSCAHWLSWRCGVGLNAARERVRVALALEERPLIAEALRSGRLSYSKARALTRIATAHNEAWLVGVGLTGTASHAERLVRYARKYGEDEAVSAANKAHAQRSVRWRWDDDGTLVVEGRLSAEDGALFIKALDAAVDSSGRPEDVTAVTSDAPTEREVLSARRADALVDLAETYLAEGYREGNAGERYQVQVVVEGKALNGVDGADGADGAVCCEGAAAVAPARLDDGPAIALETARRIACDASVVPFVEATDGSLLDVGRRTRSIPAAIQRGLKRRDGGCRFPGCTCRRFVDAHHVVHWADGGATSMDNLVLLCRGHHRLVHEGGFSVSRDEAGAGFTFRRPDGSAIPEAPTLSPAPHGERAIRQRNRADGVVVGPDTARARWGGEAMDYNIALGTLGDLARRGRQRAPDSGARRPDPNAASG